MLASRAAALLACGCFLAAILGACGPAAQAPAAPPEEPEVARTPEGALRFAWPADWSAGAVAIRAAAAPDAIPPGAPLAVADRSPVVLPDPARGRRSYFRLERAGGASTVVAERRLPLEGAANFRDLGGYRTGGGRRVRWGALYRSEDLSRLTEADLAYLRGLGIRLVCDLRSEEERREAPDRLPSPAPAVASLAIADAALSSSALRRRLLEGDLGEGEAARILRDANAAFAARHADRFAALFARLLEPGGLPALVHCTAGKDRAGFASALVLLALGVPEETVFDDYLLTNELTAERTRRSLRQIQLVSLLRTSPSEARPLLEARREYLEAGLAAIREAHGGVDRYLERGLGIDASERERLRALLLEPAEP
jgi:protein-tyrosine phosphatase